MYYKLEDNFIIKYNVMIDKDKLEEIKNIIIDQCSIISHIKYESENSFYLTKNKYSKTIKNYHEQVKEVKENNEIIKIYTISYDYYSFDLLVSIINAILNGQYEFIDYLYNVIDTRETSLNKEQNNKHELALSFIPNILATITFEEIKRYSLEELNNFTEFLNIKNIDVKQLNRKK